MKTKKLELYIHTPFCVKKCDYCDFLSFPGDSKTQIQYVHALLQEIRFWGERMKAYTVPTIYIGGGTPSWLDSELIVAILQEITKSFSVDKDAEISIECNPGTVTAAKLKAYQQAGINRLSIGLQSADNEELKLLGRIHTYEQFLKTYTLARSADYHNINIDLMSGIPYQNLDKFLYTLQQVVRLKPEHISAYSLIVEKGTPFYDRYKFDAVAQQAGIRTEILPNEDEVYRINKATQDILAQAGYEQYEISNYARPGYACRHNIGYWTRENYLGLGLGAASLIENVRYTNLSGLYDYIKGCGQLAPVSPEAFDNDRSPAVPGEQWYACNLHVSADPVDRKGQMEEFMFLGLRMNEGVTRADFERNFGVPIEAVYLEVINQLKEQELLLMREGRVFLTDRGMDLSNYAMAKFLL
jgi:oxygen-independent coproporphyrinogen-3 oxidase